MKIPLDSFEQYIDEIILKRGLKYFEEGLVRDLEEVTPGEYEAIVDGTESYTVNLTIKNKVVTEYVCTCPYDLGPVCKHVAAVIFSLQKNEPATDSIPSRGKTGSAKTPKKRTVARQVDELLNKLSHDDLKEYVKDICLKDSKLRQRFLAQYAGLVMPDSQALYTKQIRAIVKTALDTHGYIGYSEARYVGNAVHDMVSHAEKLVETANYKTALFMSCAVLEEMTKVLDFADDSNGDIGSCIEYACNVLFLIAQQKLNESLHKDLFDYCLKQWQKMTFKGWDWHFTMLDIAVCLTHNDSETKQIHALLDEVKPNNSDWDWDLKEAQRIRADLISKTEGEEQTTAFFEANLSNPDFRKEIIIKAIKEKNYSRAVALAEEGISIDAGDKPGLANDWRDCLLKVYLILDDTENIIKTARFLFLESNREKKGYFDILKKQFSPEKWGDFVQCMINEKLKKQRWPDYHLISQIWIWEERWDKLLEIVKTDTSLRTIDSYEKYLIHDYPNELIDLYRIAILKEMEMANNRGHYKEICRYLRRMIKMGARETVDSIIKQLQTTYPKRKALLEELLLI